MIALCVVVNVLPLLSSHHINNELIDYTQVDINTTHGGNDHQNDTQPCGHPVEIKDASLDTNDRDSSSTDKSRAINQHVLEAGQMPSEEPSGKEDCLPSEE